MSFTLFGKFAKASKMATFWKDGSTMSYHWNYWNPLTLIILIPLICTIILLGGINELIDNHSAYGFGYSDYWRNRLSEREFI